MKAKSQTAKAKPAPAPAPASAPIEPRRYFVSAPVDFALIGGLSIVVFLGLRYFYHPERTPLIYTLAAVGVWICNWPHFAATNYRLYHSRANIRQYPMTALAVPWLMLVAVIASLSSPDLIAPYFVKLFLIWSPYHFSGQTIGITMIYARRHGFFIGRWERLALSTFVFGTFLSQTMRAEIGTSSEPSFYGIPTPSLGLPAWSLDVTRAVMWIAGAVFLGYVIRWSVQRKRMLPAMILLPGVTQYVWFVHSSTYASYQEFVPFFHSLQYMFIAWCMQLKEKMDLDHIAPSRRYVVRETVRWGVVIMFFGAVLFFMLPRAINAVVPLPGPHSLAFATGVILAAVQIHHFFVDGVIWKLKRKAVSSPLMINLDDLVRPAPATGTPALDRAARGAA